MYRIHDCINKKVSSCEQTESNPLSSMIDGIDGGSKNSEVSSREKVQTSSMVYGTEGRIRSKELDNIYDVITNLTKSSDRIVGGDKSDLDHPYDEIMNTRYGVKGLRS